MEFYAKVKGNLSFEIKLPDESEAVNETFEFSLPCKLRLVGGKRRSAAEAHAAEEGGEGADPKWDTRDAMGFEVPANLKGHEGEVPANIRAFKQRCDEEEEGWAPPADEEQEEFHQSSSSFAVDPAVIARPKQKRAPRRPAVVALSEALKSQAAPKRLKILKEDDGGAPAPGPL